MQRPKDYKYTDSHEWISIDNDVATIGITDFAVKALRDLVALDFEETEGDIAKGNSFAVVESVKAASDIYTPVSGTIVEVNEALADDIDTLASDAFGEGWLIKIRMTNNSELESLLNLETYEATLKD